jgi:hypothetical protein
MILRRTLTILKVLAKIHFNLAKQIFRIVIIDLEVI